MSRNRRSREDLSDDTDELDTVDDASELTPELPQSGVDPRPELGANPAYHLERQDYSDIFTQVGEVLMREEEDKVWYNIRRNGDFIGKESHPFSMGMLQEKFGGGLYTITPFTPKLGKFLKAQAISISEKVDDPWQKRREDAAAASASQTGMEKMVGLVMPANPQAAAPNQPSLTEVLGTIFKVQAEAKKDASSSSDRMMEMFMQSQRAMMEMLAGRQAAPASGSSGSEIRAALDAIESLGKMMRSNMQFQAEMNENMVSMIKNSTKGAKGTMEDPMHIFKLLQESKRDALDEMKMIDTLARERAKTYSGHDDDEEEPQKNVLETALETLGPLVMEKWGGQNAPAPNPAPQERRSLPPPHGNAAPVPGGNREATARERGPVGVPARSGALPINQKTSMSFGRSDMATAITTDKTAKFTKEKAILVLGSKIPMWLLAAKKPQEAARETPEILKSAGHGVAEALELFPTPEALIAACHENGIPTAADPWLTEYHGAIRQSIKPQTLA